MDVAINDAVALLNWLFRGGPAPDCEDAADTNDDGDLNLTDAIATLRWLFLGGTAPYPPGPTVCGADPCADGLEPCRAECKG